MLLGHLATPILLKRYLKRVETVPLFAGSLFPDLLDKSLQQARLAANGRTLAHTLLSLTATTALFYRFRGRAAARSWALGYLGHLLCDIGGTVPWFYPFVAYEFVPSSRHWWRRIEQALGNVSLVETLLLLWALGILYRSNGKIACNPVGKSAVEDTL